MHSWPMIVLSMSATNRPLKPGRRADDDVDPFSPLERPARAAWRRQRSTSPRHRLRRPTSRTCCRAAPQAAPRPACHRADRLLSASQCPRRHLLCPHCRSHSQRKTALALASPSARMESIVNADSAQIYRDLPILSAAPTEAERPSGASAVRHPEMAPPGCSAADWADPPSGDRRPIHSGGRCRSWSAAPGSTSTP